MLWSMVVGVLGVGSWLLKMSTILLVLKSSTVIASEFKYLGFCGGSVGVPGVTGGSDCEGESLSSSVESAMW